MTTYTETKATLNDISERSEANRKRIEQAKAIINAAEADLLAMQSAYAAFSSQLNADAAANATDEAWISAKAEKDQMVSDFLALKTRATAAKTAIDGI